MEALEGYGYLNYLSDVTLVRRFNELKEHYSQYPTVPWREDTRVMLTTKRARVRTGEGHITSGDNASFSRVLSERVTDAQAYAVLVKEAEAAEDRARRFRESNANTTKDSPLEMIANAIHIAEVDGRKGQAARLTYALGERLVIMNRGELEKATRALGYDLVRKAYGSVQPRML